MKETILLTGGTGFLGTELAARLLRIPGVTVYALIRASDDQAAFIRAQGAWYHEKELYHAIGNQIIPLAGDFLKPGLGLSGQTRLALEDTVSVVLHAGAEVGFRKSRQELFAVNREGTENMLSFAARLRGLRRFVYLSTAYVAGRKSGRITEDGPVGTTFSSLYEKSKAEAETLVRRSGLPFSICRPGMIVGDSESGWIRSFNTVYYVLRRMLLGEMRVVPVRADTALNLVPADYVAESVIKIAFSGEALGKTFHLTCPKAGAPTAEELAAYVRSWAGRNLSVPLPKPFFLPMPGLKQAGLLHNRREHEKKRSSLSNLLTLLPYFFAEQEFDRANTDAVCGPYSIEWRDYIDRLLDFACRKNFMRQSGMTVFEQARIRRESRRYPIRYHDVTAGGIRTVSGQEANRRIEQIVNALWAWGVRKGDRVALTGINSVDYMTLEQAIGLLGAVSVPIYYTTPAAETALLLRKSGAKWFFVGDRRMMAQCGALETEARLVAFSAARDAAPAGVMRWERFLDHSAVPSSLPRCGPEDLATIRFTSGTTGEPKGVMFSYGQLTWMGEVLTNLLPWRERNRSMRYLSFLPLSHVVEGILASYAPYYMLSGVDYFYLNDFASLNKSLPKVRPNVFFSVPRFYEKVWERVEASPLGKAWLTAEDGTRRRVLAALLRRAVLRRAGIDRSKQLIVGSAPVSETLLRRFRALGIEIYNAYGQTEAPLISINRLGDNVIPTIGTPLPETIVTAEPDGELIVRGPQVTMGYYGLETPSIQNGVLRTGDLGTIRADGHITLHGRKKDFIVTAYGKNISIPKLEEHLKDIPGVSEALLIGEGRPYCTALLWSEGEPGDLDAQIEAMNARLSHPEQIRRYRVIPTPLSIQKGELTPNLKVRRGNVEANYASEIEEMYR